MKPHDTPEARAAERDRAIGILKKSGMSARSINRVMGGARVESDSARRPIADVEHHIEAITLLLLNRLNEQNWIVTIEDLKGERTTRAIAAPRGAAMYLVRKILGDGASFPAIGNYFNRDHSTVMHACNVLAWATIADDRPMKAVRRVLRAHGKRFP